MDTSTREKYKSLLQRQRELNREYDDLLDRLLEEGQENQLPSPGIGWPSRTVYVERRCALESDTDGNMHLVTLPGQRAIGLKELRDFTDQTASLIVVDPYVFSGTRESASAIADEFKRAARVGGKFLKRVHIVCNAGHTTQAVRSEIVALCAKHQVHLTERHTDTVHDRVWIADRTRGLVIGTSFNGLGSRAAFLLPLPKPDLSAMLKYLDANALSRAEA
jgi:hypothetical protein